MNDKTGTIAVVDREYIRISRIISSDKNFLREIILKTKPASLASTEPDEIIALCVPDSYNQFSLFTEGGQLIKHINDKDLKKTFNICVGSDGHIVTCEWADREIKVLSPDRNDLL